MDASPKDLLRCGCPGLGTRTVRSLAMAAGTGTDYVSIGTDQFDPRGCVEDYTRSVHLVAAMLRGGFTAEDAAKIAGGNHMPIFRDAVG